MSESEKQRKPRSDIGTTRLSYRNWRREHLAAARYADKQAREAEIYPCARANRICPVCFRQKNRAAYWTTHGKHGSVFVCSDVCSRKPLHRTNIHIVYEVNGRKYVGLGAVIDVFYGDNERRTYLVRLNNGLTATASKVRKTYVYPK